jgi:hypothetical protein
MDEACGLLDPVLDFRDDAEQAAAMHTSAARANATEAARRIFIAGV